MGALEDFLLNLDMFPKRLHLYLPNGKDKYQTGEGFFCSMIIWVLMLLYFSYAIGELVDYKDQKATLEDSESYLRTSLLPGEGRANHVQFFEQTQKDYYSYTDVIPATPSNLSSKLTSVAYAVVNSASGAVVNLDKNYVTIKPRYRIRKDGAYDSTQDIAVHSCTFEDLNGNGEANRANDLFYPAVNERANTTLSTYSSSLTCFDKKMELSGDDNSDNSDVFSLQMVKCSGSKKCKSTSQINSYLAKLKVLVVTNERSL